MSAPAEPIAPMPPETAAPAEPSSEAKRRDHARRPALDGLRALAVSGVAIYHFGGGAVSWLPGGFLGVDLFFVLSGYLITGLLLTEYAKRGRIDLLGFWVRRLRRLAPALLLVLLAVIAYIWWDTPPDAYPARRLDLFWTVGYLANWHLIATSETYFAAYTTASPLRHAWSLAVEEQFYFVWPTVLFLLLWAGRRIPAVRGLARLGRLSRARALVAVITVLGIGLSAYWMATTYSTLYPSKAYYGTQGRVQELFVGCLLAVLIPWLRRTAQGRGRVVALATVAVGGLIGLLVAFYLMPDDAAFYYRGGGLLACLAGALVIAGLELHPEGRLAKVFSWRPAVALGRISYGVYLWHWPLVVAIPVTEGMSPREHVVRQGLRVLITLAASTASFWLVEQPIMRSRKVLRSPGRVIVAALASSALVVAVAIPATALPGTLSAQVGHSSDTACPGELIDVLLSCTWPRGADTTQHPVTFGLLGDSTARALGPGLDDWAQQTGNSWLEAAWKRCTATSLMVLPGAAQVADIPATTCANQASGLISQSLAKYKPKVVLIAEFWASNLPVLVDGQKLQAGTPEHDAALEAGYLKVIDQVAAYGGKVVFLELPPPGEQLGEVVAKNRPAGHSRPPVTGGGKFVDGNNAMLRATAAARPKTASTISITDVLCPGGHCGPVLNGMLVRNDGVHYTIPFSRYLVPIIMQRIAAAQTSS